MLNLEYFWILFILIFSLILSCIILFLSYLLIYQENDSEKVSPYECGFQPFEDARQKFDIHFYLVAILFIIFDLEIMYLFPWSVSLTNIGIIGFWNMWFFIILLVIGFVYEWKKGALEWTTNSDKKEKMN